MSSTLTLTLTLSAVELAGLRHALEEQRTWHKALHEDEDERILTNILDKIDNGNK